MLKKISVSRLKPGMFIHELCGDWMSHPFWRAQFVLRSEADLARIVDSGIGFVYIDTTKGLDDAEAVSAQSVQESIEAQIVAAVATPDDGAARVSVHEEMARARKVQRFLSQPFYVAEVFTGVSGETVPVAETVESFEAIVNGELDEVPEQAFLNVGGVEQVLAKAKALQEGAA